MCGGVFANGVSALIYAHLYLNLSIWCISACILACAASLTPHPSRSRRVPRSPAAAAGSGLLQARRPSGPRAGRGSDSRPWAAAASGAAGTPQGTPGDGAGRGENILVLILGESSHFILLWQRQPLGGRCQLENHPRWDFSLLSFFFSPSIPDIWGDSELTRSSKWGASAHNPFPFNFFPSSLLVLFLRAWFPWSGQSCTGEQRAGRAGLPGVRGCCFSPGMWGAASAQGCGGVSSAQGCGGAASAPSRAGVPAGNTHLGSLQILALP